MLNNFPYYLFETNCRRINRSDFSATKVKFITVWLTN